MKTNSTPSTLPLEAMSRKMPKMYSGRSGTMTVSMTFVTTSFISTMRPRSVGTERCALASPRTKASTSAVITPMTGGSSRLK